MLAKFRSLMCIQESLCLALALAGSSFVSSARLAARTARTPPAPGPDRLIVRSADYRNQTATVLDPVTHKTLVVEQRRNFGSWTLMAILKADLAVFENVQDRKGDIVFVGKQGVVLQLPKSLEATSVPPGTLYHGRTLEEIAATRADVLGEELLRGNDDPRYGDVAAALPPLRVPSFVGTPHSDEKPTFDYGGSSDEIYIDVGKLFDEIQAARVQSHVWEGLIGGWLPVNRFVFPVSDQRYWEETIFAEESPGHFWTQPVWYRVLLVDSGQLKEVHYYYHHLPFPPRGEPAAADFYSALLQVQAVWKRDLNPPMKIDVPDKRIPRFCLHALLLERITRVGDHPKYGYPPLGGINLFGGYGYNNVDTFQDTFNTSVDVFLEWGLFDIAARYIDDYFTNSVRDDGSIDTRGPEIGQYGKMLTEVGKFYAYTRDQNLIRKHQKKIQAIVNLFRSLRNEAEQVPRDDISYGIIRGWSEHDSSLKTNPYRFMQPHFSNNAEAARGFHELGEAWIDMGRKSSDLRLVREGERLLKESGEMKTDLEAAIARSIDRTQSPPYMPAVAGDKPTYGKERVYAEMLDSGELTKDQARIILDSLAANGFSMFGLLRSGENIDGFLDYGPAYTRVQNDWPREFLLLYYAHMAHLYSPGTWTSVESAKLEGMKGGPYCTPAEVAIPTFTKWMLVFEDPDAPIVWLAKTTPRAWLAEGQEISVQNAPTRFGSITYELKSDVDHDRVSGVVRLPEGFRATARLRVRATKGKQIRSVRLNGTIWRDFSAEQEVITIPAPFGREITVDVFY